MLRLLSATPVDTRWDTILPPPLQQLPTDLAGIDRLLGGPALLEPVRGRWTELPAGRTAVPGRPTIPMATCRRLMVLKHRYGWGDRTLLAAVNDSLHRRRFCQVSLLAPVPDESTVRKLTRRLGPAVVDERMRGVITQALRERRCRPRALRPDATVAEADIRFPTDLGLGGDAVRCVVRAARQVRAALPRLRPRVRDRRRAIARRWRALTRSLRRRTGEAQRAVPRLTEEAAALVRATVRDGRRLLAAAHRGGTRAGGARPSPGERALHRLPEVMALATRVVEPIRLRFAHQKIPDRLVSFADPDARPGRRGKLARPNEFGYVVQIAEVTEHTHRGARGLILPPQREAGSTPENRVLPETVAELQRLHISLRAAAGDAGFQPADTPRALATVGAQVFITGAAHPGSRRTPRRLARYRVGAEGRIAHLKRELGAGRSRRRGLTGGRIWEGWAILTYHLVTLARKARVQPVGRRTSQ